MQDTPLERRRMADIQAAIERAKAYAAAQEVPLTVERLAAEMEMDLTLLHRILRGEVAAKSPGMKAKVAAITATMTMTTMTTVRPTGHGGLRIGLSGLK